MAAEDECVYYEIEACPLAHECNEGNFKNCKAWGSTREEAKQKVLNHLLRSGLHADARKEMGVAEAKAHFAVFVDLCEIVERTWYTKKKRKTAEAAESRSAAAAPREEGGGKRGGGGGKAGGMGAVGA